MYKIRCSVSGGITGYREAFLKDDDGKEVEVADRGEAEKIADEYNSKPRGGMATFRAWVVGD